MVAPILIGKYFSVDQLNELRELKRTLRFSDPWMIKMDDNGQPIIGTQKLDRDFRSCTIADVDPKTVRPITDQLVDVIGEQVEARETTFSDYVIGDHFAYHVDHGEYAPQRKWTAITMLNKQDLEGGLLCLYDTEAPYIVDLEVGETIIHCSTIPHKLTEITNGWRSVFISWYY